MNTNTLALVREEFSKYEAQCESILGHSHLANALELATELIESTSSAEDKEICRNCVLLYAEKIKRRSLELLKKRNAYALSQAQLKLLAANLRLFLDSEIDLSTEFLNISTNFELRAFLKNNETFTLEDIERIFQSNKKA